MPTRKESDLYAPIKAFLEAQGYTVRGEVNDCDLVAVQGDDLVVVELKVAFNLALVLQGIQRQAMTDAVFVAVEAPRSRRSAPRWGEVKGLCRRLGLGLLAVHFTGRSPTVEVICEPEPYTPRKQPKRRARLMREFQRRSGDHNTGGSNGRPIVTAYREEALRIALFLQESGPAPTKAIRLATGLTVATTVLSRNYYGWFQRVERGIYTLTPAGAEALRLYADVVDQAAPSRQ